MIPNKKYIKITDNLAKIDSFLNDLVLLPRLKMLEWSSLTKQTPNIKIGYTGQHLASLITGIEGRRTGARGDDLADGTEVKSCSRVDQLDTCKDCGSKVLRLETNCSNCNSSRIERKDDSKWLFGVRTEDELDLLIHRIDRVFLLFSDYPFFEDNNFSVIRFQAYEIWNNTRRHEKFGLILSNYYENIYLEHKRRKPTKNPAPKNFWPYSYQFYLCNPLLTFSATIEDANHKPRLTIDTYIEPEEDRSGHEPVPMPISLIKKDELQSLLLKAPKELVEPCLRGISYDDLIHSIRRINPDLATIQKVLPFISEDLRLQLDLREDTTADAKSAYRRR